MRTILIALLLLVVSAGIASAQVCAYASFGTGLGAGGVKLIDTVLDRPVQIIGLGREVDDSVVAPDRNTVFIGNFDDSNISVIDALTNSAKGTISVDDPDGMAVTPDGKFLYVSNFSPRRFR
jgi:YVTN family beta-propeller protein